MTKRNPASRGQIDWTAFYNDPDHRLLTVRQVMTLTKRSSSSVRAAAELRCIRLAEAPATHLNHPMRCIEGPPTDWVAFFSNPGHLRLTVAGVVAATGRATRTVRQAVHKLGILLPGQHMRQEACQPMVAPLGAVGDSARRADELSSQQRAYLTSGQLTAGELAVMRRHRPLIARELHL